MGNQGFFFFPPSSPDVKDENCWIHSSAISSDPVHHSGERHSWLAHAALLYFPCCSSASSCEQRCLRNWDVEKEQSTGRNLGARQKRKTPQYPLLHLGGLCCCAAELETSILCLLAKDKHTTEPPVRRPATWSPVLGTGSPAWKTATAQTRSKSAKRWQLFWYETFNPAVFQSRTKAVRRYWFQ